MTPEQLIFLPGASGLGEFWAPVAERLVCSAPRVFFDLPGMGYAPPVAGIDSFEDLVAMVTAELDRPTAIIAQSMGGLIAMRAALANPTMISHLVLTATSGGIDVGAFGAKDWRPEYRTLHPEAPEWHYERGPDLSPSVQTIDIPTLLIWAEDDPISPLAVGEQLHMLLPNSTLVSFPSDDHWVARAHADLVAVEIDELLSAVPEDPADASDDVEGDSAPG